VSDPRTSGLEFLGRLAGGLVHEIKNPLSTMRINLTLLKEDLHTALPEDTAFQRRIEVLEKEVRRLDAVLNEFMRYAGVRRLDRRRHDLRDLTADIVEFIGPGFRRDGVSLEANVPSIQVDVDEQLFKRALFNLLLNAQQAIQASGTVRVEGGRTGTRAWVEVRDDGAGIPSDCLDKVFEVYYSRSKEGSGLGLPTARRILEEHGGSLQLTSREGEGTCVRLEIPLP
jgi:signal transduction histidine kinase